MKHIKSYTEQSNSVNEFFGDPKNTGIFKYKLEDLNIDAVLDGLSGIRSYDPIIFERYFGDRILKSYKPDLRTRTEMRKDSGGGYY